MVCRAWVGALEAAQAGFRAGMANSQRFCIFCGRSGLSREHIWPEWSYRYVPKLGRAHTRMRQRSVAGISGLSDQKRYQGDVNASRIKAVCKDCNSGWMSRLEASARFTLVPLIEGKPAVMAEQRQRVLAAWVAMKSMVIEFSNAEDAVTKEDEREFLMLHMEPPPNWRIWIAKQHGLRWRTGLVRAANTIGFASEGGTKVLPDSSFAKNTQSITLGFGQLLIHAFSTRVPGLEPQPSPPMASALRKIWPLSPGFLWPAGPVITDFGIDALSVALPTLGNSLPWRPARFD
jgi:hypothetical protein